ncbi:hypothetical protein Hanom_Chr17g01545601 [Helianthus anomalus]
MLRTCNLVTKTYNPLQHVLYFEACTLHLIWCTYLVIVACFCYSVDYFLDKVGYVEILFFPMILCFFLLLFAIRY